ncbi:MAG TPA: GNAT family N-acetyltransferase [Micromonosporaceae bacterium]|nr:GNAT family N-acetyltransferase [Micromonosporaceae bacterium]
MRIEVADAPEAGRYEARVDGRLAGFVEYRRRPDAVVLVHTEVLPDFEGKGVGSVLARQVLDDVRARGGKVVPLCPFIASYIQRHQDYADLVAQRPTTRP